MSICASHKPRKPVRTIKRALRAVGFSTAAAFVGLGAATSPAWADESLQAGQVWSGSYRCAAISGRASLEVTRFELIAERPGWQRIEATLTIEEGGRRGVARFAANSPSRSDAFLLGLREWVEQPAGIEFQRLRLQPMRDAGGVARIGVNVHGRPDCIVNGVDTLAFMAEPARPDRAAQARSADTVPAGRVGTAPAHTVPAVSAPQDLLPAPAGIDARAPRTDVPCTPRNVVQTEPGLPEADPAQWRRLMPILHAWGTKHYRFTGPGCTVEWSFVVRQWQAVAGHPVTGVLTAADLQAVARAVEQSGRSAAAAAAATPPARSSPPLEPQSGSLGRLRELLGFEPGQVFDSSMPKCPQFPPPVSAATCYMPQIELRNAETGKPMSDNPADRLVVWDRTRAPRFLAENPSAGLPTVSVELRGGRVHKLGAFVVATTTRPAQEVLRSMLGPESRKTGSDDAPNLFWDTSELEVFAVCPPTIKACMTVAKVR